MPEPALILIVDDTLDNLRVLTGILKQEYRIKVATGGEEALQLARAATPPDLILLDIMMPVMDGHEVCRQLKAQEETRDIPVIFVTAKTHVDDETLGLALGAVDYILKPISPPIVLARVATHLRLARFLRESRQITLETRQHLAHETLARTHAEQVRQRIQEGKSALMPLLGTSLKPLSLHEQLDAALHIISTLPWLSIQSKGAIFLADADGSMILMASKELNSQQELICSHIPFGHCLCGQAIQTRQVIYSNRLDEHPGVTCQGEPGQGHYVLPLVDGNRVIGLMRCYVREAHEPQDEELDFMEELAHVLGEIVSRRVLESKLLVSRYELERNQRLIINKLVTAAELRDNETGLHILRMSHYSAIIAGHLGLSDEEQEMLLATTPMHDVGKIGIADSILLKEGKLTDDEFAIMKTHTLIGGQILTGNTPLLVMARTIALTHHEKWDGSGYPHALRGEEIPLVGRICAIADVFDALTSARPYKTAWSVERAVALIQEQSGRHFDPKLVNTLMAALPEILHIKGLYGTNAQTQDGIGFLSSLPLSETDSPLWNDRLFIGVPMIDEQHRYLFKLLHHLEQTLEQHFAILDICRALTELESYVEFHFDQEEAFLRQHHDPDYTAHKERHQAFMIQINHLWSSERENAYLAGVKLVAFLKEWLLRHVMVEDMQIRRCLTCTP
ncbi:MAG: response regulator [Magnetococcales bacterium]|nr:response regulator [Magnetococcales bacterium]